MKSKLARLRLAALVVVAGTFSTVVAADQYQLLTLTWVPPEYNEDGSPLIDLVGYYIYEGQTPDALLPRYFTVAETIQVDHWEIGGRYFAVTAVNTSGVESVLAQPVEMID
jgi:hypothetical protein